MSFLMLGGGGVFQPHPDGGDPDSGPGANAPAGGTAIVDIDLSELPLETPLIDGEGKLTYVQVGGGNDQLELLDPHGIRTHFREGDPAGEAPPGTRFEVRGLDNQYLPRLPGEPGGIVYIRFKKRFSTNWTEVGAGTKDFFVRDSNNESITSFISQSTNGAGAFFFVEGAGISRGFGGNVPGNARDGEFHDFEVKLTLGSGGGATDGRVDVWWDNTLLDSQTNVAFDRIGEYWRPNYYQSVKTFGGGGEAVEQDQYIDVQFLYIKQVEA